MAKKILMERPEVGVVVIIADFDIVEYPSAKIPPKAVGTVKISEEREGKYRWGPGGTTPHFIQVLFHFDVDGEERKKLVEWSKQTVGPNVLGSFYQDCELGVDLSGAAHDLFLDDD